MNTIGIFEAPDLVEIYASSLKKEGISTKIMKDIYDTNDCTHYIVGGAFIEYFDKTLLNKTVLSTSNVEYIRNNTFTKLTLSKPFSSEKKLIETVNQLLKTC
jgi:hypothetical protein